jgi:hypothetical protein
MASHSAFKIPVTREAYGSFFVTIRAGEMPERLAARLNPESETPHDISNSELPVHPQLSGHAAGDEAKSDWTVAFRSRPATLPV